MSGGTVGGLMGLMLLIFVAYKYRQHAIAMRPIDFQAVFDAMIDSGEISTVHQRQGEHKLSQFGHPLPREIPRKCITKNVK